MRQAASTIGLPRREKQTGDERGVGACDRGDWPAVLLRHGGGDGAKDGIADRTGTRIRPVRADATTGDRRTARRGAASPTGRVGRIESSR